MSWWLKAVPWSVIIANAPALVEGARKLLDKRRSTEAGDLPVDETSLARRLAALEGRERRMLELIESLANSNQQLIVALDGMRRRLRIGFAVAIALAIGLLVALVRSFPG
jgi:hypothetical protein